MREREKRAIAKKEARKECFEQIKEDVGIVFLYPTFQRNLEFALIYPNLSEEEQTALFEQMVQINAELCLSGEPEYAVLAEFQCQWLVDMVGHLAHARPALERAVELYHKAGKEMPRSLRKWAENRGDPLPQKRGPRPSAQDWKALRDHIIAFAIGCEFELQKNPLWPVELPIRRTTSSKSGKKDYSICRAVIEVLERRYGNHPDCFLPTYKMVWKAWERYRDEIRPNGKPRPGRPLLPRQGLKHVLNPPGIATEPMQKEFRKRSEDHLRRCDSRDFDASR